MSQLREQMREIGGYVGRFLAEHGIEVGATAVALGARRVRGCHGNASQLARRWPERYTWWTGVAREPTVGATMMHSWVERDGEHLEITWAEVGSEYLGVPVTADTVVSGYVDGHPIDNVAYAAALNP